MILLSDGELERSAVVANCRMNRERELDGSNGYGKEVGFAPMAFLQGRANPTRRPRWLDLCCGSGRALIQAADAARLAAFDVEIVGVDLVGFFREHGHDPSRLRLIESSLRTWQPEEPFDLITCIHGLHYVGDKLGLIARAVSWLVPDGLFAANLDLRNLKLRNGPGSASLLRGAGLEFNGRRRLVVCEGRRSIEWPLRYLGGDVDAGPNYTGQPAVDSHYESP
ncbi:class I SAM-dependent methyltransferase [Paludisphaera rhizosphaerae]|uniref:class I SAM-dependent methyltransferase n=1 Tax=Paludisphaera rhizosphaerae TaxID=2711216 RepID=UPI0013EDF9A1|nr:class I SAM-dependent methyltransferase [Paludisphaera rhizosphaerae]